jgi:hypothetical protein
MNALKCYLKIIILYALIPLKLFSQDDLLAYVPGSVCRNYINIAGNTNINHFEFRLDFPLHQIFSVDNTSLASEQNTGLYEIPLPVKSFEAGNQLLYNDFLTLLKANLYPKIIIGIGYNQLLGFLEGENYTVQNIRITLAGVTKEYPVSCIVNSCSDNLVYISGYKHIKLTDFNINPPEKFQGLVKVENEVMINFGFVFLFRNENKILKN